MQYVQLDECKSNISLGVPQGSILGPLLFNIYINDIQFSTDFLNFIKYADDTNLFYPMVQNVDSVVINNELEKVLDWLTVNMLSVNVKKTKCMLFRNVGRNINSIIPEIKLKNITVERVEYFNFLGVTLDQHLNWKAHMDNVAIKISKYNGLLCKFKHFFPFTILYTLYNSLILTHLTYAILAWGNNSKSTYLFKIQKKVIRNVTNIMHIQSLYLKY